MNIEDVGQMADATAGPGLDAALELVAALIRRGETTEFVLLSIVAPSARLLGDQWLADARPFVDVVRGLSVIGQLVESLRVS